MPTDAPDVPPPLPPPLCFRCLYDLRAAAPGSTCPECGLPVSTSSRSWRPEHHPRWLAVLRQALLFTAAEYAALSLLIAVELHSVSARLTDALLFPPMAIAGVLGGLWTARFAAASARALPRVLLFTATAAVAVPYAAMVVFSSYALIDPLTWDPRFIRDVAFALFLLNVGKSAVQFAALSVRCDRLPGRWHGRGLAAAATAATLTWAIAAATVVLALPDRFRIPLVTTISLLAAAVAAFLVYACASIRPLLARPSP